MSFRPDTPGKQSAKDELSLGIPASPDRRPKRGGSPTPRSVLNSVLAGGAALALTAPIATVGVIAGAARSGLSVFGASSTAKAATTGAVTATASQAVIREIAPLLFGGYLDKYVDEAARQAAKFAESADTVSGAADKISSAADRLIEEGVEVRGHESQETIQSNQTATHVERETPNSARRRFQHGG